MSNPVQLTGGNFQDAEGNVLENGYLVMTLSQDASAGTDNVCAGVSVTIRLGANGSVVTSPPQYVWGNDALLPVNTYYRVTGYAASGQPVWGPNNQQVVGSGTFDVGLWVPNSVISWVPPIQPLVLEVDGTLAQVQTLLNLTAGSGVTITDEGGGEVEISATASGVPSGMNVWPAGYGGWVTNNPQAVVVGGNTAANMLPGRLAVSMPASWKVALKPYSGTCILTAASIATCNADSETINTQTPITFGGLSSVSFTSEVVSDPIAIQIDADHDYYLFLYFDPSSSDLLMWQSNIWANAPFGGIYSSKNMTTAASVADASLTTDSYRFFYKIVAT